MKLTISKEVFNKFPKLKLGIVIAKNINNKGSDDKIYHLLEEIENLIKFDFTPENIAKHPLISPWRTAYSEFGSKPSSYHCSVETLMRNVLKGRGAPRINKAVDVSNYLSLKHLIPMGVQDLDKIEGSISLKIATGKEKFTSIGSDEEETPSKGEVIYKDSKDVLCRRWNWRDADKAKIEESSENIIYYIDALPPINKTKIKEVLGDIIDLLAMFCQPEETKIFVLDKSNSSISF
ncbi:MAG: phenylalanine--tRNA ligase beta subunit-related protein [Candidatus Woesearchaeota archaeon]